MGKYTKLVAAICNNPKTVRFDEACKVAESLGFTYSVAKARIAYLNVWGKRHS